MYTIYHFTTVLRGCVCTLDFTRLSLDCPCGWVDDILTVMVISTTLLVAIINCQWKRKEASHTDIHFFWVLSRMFVCVDSSCGQDVCVVWCEVVNRTSVWYGVDSSCEQDVCVVWCGLKLWTGRLCGMVWTQDVYRTSVWYGVDSSSEQDVCVVWCGLKLWPGRLCGMEWTQVVARTSVCVDSSCSQDVCVVWCGLKLWPGRLCVWTQVVGTTSVCVDSSCGQVVKPRGYLSCTHVTLTLVCHVRWSALPAHSWHFLQTSAYQRSDLILTTLKASHRMNLLRAHVLSSCSMDHDSCGTLTPDPICDVPSCSMNQDSRVTVTSDPSCDVPLCSMNHDSRNTVTVDPSCDVLSCSMNHDSRDNVTIAWHCDRWLQLWCLVVFSGPWFT